MNKFIRLFKKMWYENIPWEITLMIILIIMITITVILTDIGMELITRLIFDNHSIF